MKKILLFLPLFLTINKSVAQLEFKNSNVGILLDFTDLNGNTVLPKYDPNTIGSPFIIDDWLPAKIMLSKGKVGIATVKLNIESNELYFRDSTGRELVAVDGMVKKIDYPSFFSKDSIPYVFKSGYPSIDKQNENFYYQVFAEGEVELLAKRFKYIRVNKDAFSFETSKEFVDGGLVLYVFSNKNMQFFHPTKNFILALFKNKEQAVNMFMANNKTNFKKIPDLIKLFHYYNKSTQ